MKYSVSIVTVNYNTAALLRSCLRSLERHIHLSYEVIVVDNSSEAELNQFPWTDALRLVRPGENLGFAKACNLGAKYAHGEIIHFLNPDCEVLDGIDAAYRSILHQELRAIFVTHVKDSEGKSSKVSHALPIIPNLINVLFRPHETKLWFLGASLILPKRVFDELGGFSEDYFMYAEDMDLFYKAYLMGIPTQPTSAGVVHHQGGASKTVWSKRQRLERVEASAAIFTRKFRLKLDYFIFKHLGFIKGFRHGPTAALMELAVYWKQLLCGAPRDIKP